MSVFIGGDKRIARLMWVTGKKSIKAILSARETVNADFFRKVKIIVQFPSESESESETESESECIESCVVRGTELGREITFNRQCFSFQYFHSVQSMTCDDLENRGN